MPLSFCKPDLFGYIVKLCGQTLQATDWVIVVNPRHVKFYQKAMLFEPIGPTVSYAKVKNAPGVPMRLNLSAMRRAYFQKYAHRTGSKNLFRLFFVNNQVQLARDIGEGLEKRNRLMTRQFFNDFFTGCSDVLDDPVNYAVVCREWIGIWLRQEQDAKCAV